MIATAIFLGAPDTKKASWTAIAPALEGALENHREDLALALSTQAFAAEAWVFPYLYVKDRFTNKTFVLFHSA